jgi:trypsin-like peptidase
MRVLVVYSCFSRSAAAQEAAFPTGSSSTQRTSTGDTQHFSETVVPITSIKITPSIKLSILGKPVPQLNEGAYLGTGFCLDPSCLFIATNYHVAAAARPRKIKGEKIIERYFATGPDDQGATLNFIANLGPLPYATKRDLAIFELQRSLPHHHGLNYGLDELEAGEEVDIYGYPKGTIPPIRTLTRFPATFRAPTTSGLLAFDYRLSSDKPNRMEGASGGIVVDRKTEKIVGILSEGNETMALAVPIQTLVDFARKVRPFLAAKIFPTTNEVSPVSADIYPRFVPSPDHYPRFLPSHVDGLQHRPEEPHEVSVLRQKAQLLADSMLNFIAVQTYEWGRGDEEPELEDAYEVRVFNGEQRFRDYPDGDREFKHARFPRWRVRGGWVLGSDEWSQLPKMVGTEFRLKIHQAADVVVNERRIKVFQYYSSVEDNLCGIHPFTDYGFFMIGKDVAVACYGEVWTDDDSNIIRMSEHLDLSDKLKAYKHWEDYWIVLTYGWLKRADEPPRLIPLTTYVQGKNKEIYWCRGAFTNYQVFSSKSRLLTGSLTP